MVTNVPFSTIVRLTLITVGGVVFSLVVPAGYDPLFHPLDVAVAVFAGAVISVLIFHALDRRRRLMEAVRMELNKLRRMYHLSKNMAEGSNAYRTWFTDIHGMLYGYLSLFNGKTFDAYDGFNAAFRKLSYHVYQVPPLDSRKAELLYDDLLKTTAQVAEARQQIKELWDERFSTYVWMSVLLMALGVIVATSLGLVDAFDSRLSGAATIVTVLHAVDLLWKVDSMRSEKKSLPKRYFENLSRLQLGRSNVSLNP